MTLASCNDRNIAKSERHVESAFRLVNHPVNLTPMWDGLLPSSDSATFLGPRARFIKTAIGICPPISKLITSSMPLVEHTESSLALTAYRTCAQSETTLQS